MQITFKQGKRTVKLTQAELRNLRTSQALCTELATTLNCKVAQEAGAHLVAVIGVYDPQPAAQPAVAGAK